MTSAKIKTIVLATSALFIAGAIIAYPETSVNASLAGLKMWWNVVFPSLLPFFIVSELLIGFGIVTFIGVLLEPVMRPIFRVPGVGAFVFVMGLLSGFPAGAKITARLYEEKQLTKTEAERLASFTNFSNPLFMFGVVAIGFFENAALGIIFALSHYIGNFSVGIMMRFYKGKEAKSDGVSHLSPRIVTRAFRSMHRERLKNRRPIGKMLGDAIQSSVTTLLMVGGFIILFSVFNRLLYAMGGTEIIAVLFKHILAWLNMTPQLGSGIVPGLFEITVGAQRISEIHAPLIEAVVITAFILGFGGFSIQAQVASILAEAKLSAKPFFFGRLFHGVFSAVSAALLFKVFDIPAHDNQYPLSVPVFQRLSQSMAHFTAHLTDAMRWGALLTLFVLIIYIFYKAIRTVSEHSK